MIKNNEMTKESWHISKTYFHLHEMTFQIIIFYL
jgi:hypothetical protein